VDLKSCAALRGLWVMGAPAAEHATPKTASNPYRPEKQTDSSSAAAPKKSGLGDAGIDGDHK
jgi:hypothetical protein